MKTVFQIRKSSLRWLLPVCLGLLLAGLGCANTLAAAETFLGTIITVDEDANLVYLDAGYEAGLELKQQLISYRKGGIHVSRFVVTEIMEGSLSTARIIKRQKRQPKEGDVFLAAFKGENCRLCHKDQPRYQAERLHGKAHTVKCASCHATHEERPLGVGFEDNCNECHQINLDGTKTHQSFLQSGCLSCHQVHPPPDSSVISTSTSLCVECHPLEKKKVAAAHFNVIPTKDKCYICHDPHNKHEGKYLYEQKHPPFEDASCDECHTENEEPAPPGWKFKEHASELCYECHDKFEGDLDKIHLPVVSGDCVECHSPHLSSQEYFLKKKPTTLCFDCHEQVIAKVNKHRPATEGRCLTCHQPHSSELPSLLREPVIDLCEKCHKVTRAVFKNTHKPFTERKCIACHSAHSTQEKYLLVKKATDTCLACHTNLEETTTPRHQKMFNKPKPPGFPRNGYTLKLSADNQTTCFTCHEPHGSKHNRLLREEKEFLCKLCHSGHWLKVFGQEK